MCFDYIALLAQYLLLPRNSVADGRAASTKESSTTTNLPCSLAWMPCAFVTKRSGACAMPRASAWWRCPTGGISRCLPSLPRYIPSTLLFSMRSQLNYEWNVNRSLCSVLLPSYGRSVKPMRHPVSSRPCLLRARATDPMHLFLVGRHIQRSSRLLMLRRCGTASRAGAAVRQISFWGEEANERAVLEHIRKSLGEEDWTGADREVVEELGAAFLLEKYGTLAAAAEAHAIPSRAAPSAADNLVATMSAKSHGSEGMEGTSGKRGGREPSQWASKESRRRFFDGVAASLALESTQDWRSVPRQSITRLGTPSLLSSSTHEFSVAAGQRNSSGVEWCRGAVAAVS